MGWFLRFFVIFSLYLGVYPGTLVWVFGCFCGVFLFGLPWFLFVLGLDALCLSVRFRWFPLGTMCFCFVGVMLFV